MNEVINIMKDVLEFQEYNKRNDFQQAHAECIFNKGLIG